MDGISTSSRCSSKLKRRRVNEICEFPRGCGRFPIAMDSSDCVDDIVDHVKPPQTHVIQAVPRKYPPPRILKGFSVQRDFPIGFKRQHCVDDTVDPVQPPRTPVIQVVVPRKHPPPRILKGFSVQRDFPTGFERQHCVEDTVDPVQPPQNPVIQAVVPRKHPPPRILKGSSVQQDFPSGFRRQDLHSATKKCLPNAVSAAKPVQKAAAETAARKSSPPAIFSARQVSPAAKQNIFSVYHDISANDCRKQNSFVSQENVSTNSCGNQNLGSVSKDILLQNGNSIVDYPKPSNAISVTDFRPMRFDVTLGNKETGRYQESSINRDKVKEVLRLFHQTLAKLLKENVAKPKSEKDYNVPRCAAILLKDHQKWINTSKQVGPVPGVNIGDKFRFQSELNVIGLHCHFRNGIDYVKKNGISLATSIVVSDRYANNMESSDVLIYSGHGGNPAVGGREAVKDQKLERGNLALKNNMDHKTPVRVICKRKPKSSKASFLKAIGRCKNLNPMYVYDGLYTVEEFWNERGEFGKLVFKFKLKRNWDQPKLP